MQTSPFFYKAIKNHVLNGDMGKIISIETCEHVSYHHMAASYVRGKWCSEKVCFAPMLLAIPFYYLADKYCEMMSSPYLRERLAESGLFFAEAVTEKTKAIIAVDLGGVPCDYERLYAIVERQ